ncbi:glycoside hydrolase family 18, putative [Bodo saltans]|uniref:Glycoside hydrolase family 18, putative n=1 Tax=Bodo saltans TaxID=75058 RepID=A0A0S4J833_BODSA|nr:glycoside hydrolase family 18, putative [Bodo saltans]|eukprot:CUG85388.1 glycoside hydrolase family 18, putative [Bodo saltans]
MATVETIALVTITVLLLLSASTTPVTAETTPEAAQPFTVFGYLPEYRLRGYNYTAAFQTGLTHLIYFSLEVDARTFLPKAKDRLPTMIEAKQAREAADAVGGKIILSFGGNARSNGFAEMVATPSSRRVFLGALEALLTQYDFDGVDYNWEYPRDAEEWRRWALLLKESKDTLKGGDRSQNIVTFTMYLDPKHADVIQRFNMLEHADYVHCMAYDQHGEHSTYEFAVSGVRMAIEKKMTLSKFTLGVPFYARHVGNGEPKTYGEIIKEIPKSKRWTQDRVGPYYLNSPSMIQKKTKLAIDNQLGGVMIWELGQDLQPESHRNSLLRGILKATLTRGLALPKLQEQLRAAKEETPSLKEPRDEL